jgi:hypothetical protein
MQPKSSPGSPKDYDLLNLLLEVAREEAEERGLPPGSLDEPFLELLRLTKGLPNEPDSSPTPSESKTE